MKFTKSVDGRMRATLWVRIRVEADDLEALKCSAAANGCKSVHDYLGDCLRDGIVADRIARAADDQLAETNDG